MSSKKVFPQVTIDLMNKADLPEIMAIERESFASPCGGIFSKEIDSAHSMCLCVRINFGSKNVVGAYIIFWLVADEAHLHNLAVKKEYRSQGLAFGLMEAMKEIAGVNKITSQTLEVRESNTEAIKLYRKCGFVSERILVSLLHRHL